MLRDLDLGLVLGLVLVRKYRVTIHWRERLIWVHGLGTRRQVVRLGR